MMIASLRFWMPTPILQNHLVDREKPRRFSQPCPTRYCTGALRLTVGRAIDAPTQGAPSTVFWRCAQCGTQTPYDPEEAP
jgi:hypothetical protein